MIYRMIPPPPDLAAVVRFFWVFELDPLPCSPYVYRSMADGCAELIFHYKGSFQQLHVADGRQPHALIHAPARQPSRFVTTESFGIFGAYLYPFALPRLFRFPVPEISGTLFDLGNLPGHRSRDLEERMREATHTAGRVQLLTEYLRVQLQATKPVESRVAAAIHRQLHAPEPVSLDALIATTALSVRQFERRFRELTGFPPKLYSRILRFQSALKQYGRPLSLTSIAYECGYYDQAHFIREFREFSGYHPGAYFKGHPEGVEWRG